MMKIFVHQIGARTTKNAYGNVLSRTRWSDGVEGEMKKIDATIIMRWQAIFIRGL